MAENDERDEELEETIKAIQEAEKKYEELCQNEHARYIAELRQKYVEETVSVRQLGYEKGLEEGIVKGIEEGEEKGRKAGLEEGKKAGLEKGKKAGLEERNKEIARIMKENNYSIEEIINITGLTKKEIEKI